ncbi:MAG: hypothetical protein JWN48_2891 [Myxococcaceae bacterium]|nr:hypothetical protein [Myxococcaceae bacterium]
MDSQPLRNYKGAPDRVTFRAHAKLVGEAARRLAAAAPAPLDGAPVEAKRVLEIDRSHFANFIVSKPIRSADMALIACDAAGGAAGNQIVAQARADVTSDEFVRWLAPVLPLVSDRKRLHDVANEKLALLKLQRAGESPWASEV